MKLMGLLMYNIKQYEPESVLGQIRVQLYR